MFALTATRRSGGVRRLLLLTTAVRHASALTAVVALRAQSNLLPVRHRALRCAPALLAWEPPPGFKEWKEGDVPFDEEEDDRSFDMFDLVSDGPERRPGFQRRASSPEDFVEALLDVPAGCCPGCGATFQSADPDAPGFVPQSVLDARSAAGAKVEGGEGAPLATKTETICQRCHGLRYQNRLPVEALRVGTQAQHEELQPEHFRELLRGLARRRCLVIAVVDLFDFDGSFTPDLAAIVGPSNPLIVVANKVDLLPRRANPEDVRRWVRRACARHGVTRIASTHLVSCKSCYISLYLPYTSPIPPLYLPYISPVSPLGLVQERRRPRQAARRDAADDARAQDGLLRRRRRQRGQELLPQPLPQPLRRQEGHGQRQAAGQRQQEPG